jgi:hypothetical protein
MKTMAFTADVYNSAVSDPASFAEKNILNEVEEMVSGLENIQSATSYRAQESFFNPNTIIITGDDMVRFKGEKISGALGFLDQLQTLAPITDKVGFYIKRIMNCNFAVVAELEKAISSKKKYLETILAGIEKEQPKWDELSSKNSEYNKTRDEMRDAIAEEEEFKGKTWSTISDERDKRFSKEHPEYAAFKVEYDAEHKVYYDMCAKRDQAESFIEEIQSYLDKIEKHKDYMTENNIAA